MDQVLIFTKAFFDSVGVIGDLSLANNSLVKVLSSLSNETTCEKKTKELSEI